MHIVAVQLDTLWEDRRANHERVQALLAGVSVEHALVVLPEMFDTGFSMNTAATDPGPQSSSEAFCHDLAISRRAMVLAGIVARAPAGGLANVALAISPDGVELCRYAKMRPFTLVGEHVHYPAGAAHQTFQWDGTQVAPFICYDLRFPELFRPAAGQGAELLVVIANWPAPRTDHWTALLRARAIENQAFVLGVNRRGSDPNHTYEGRSALFDPHGNAVFQAGSGEQVLSARIETAVARQWRQEFPALRDINPS